VLNNKKMLRFFAVSVVFYMASGFAHPVTPTLFQSLNLGNYMFGYALAAMMTMYFIFSPFWGKLNDYISSKTIMLIGCTGYAIGQVFFLLAHTELQFICARAFAGIFTGSVFVAIMNYTVHMAEDETQRGVWLTTGATIQSVSAAFGFFGGGMIGSIKTEYAIIAQITLLASCGILFSFVCEKDVKENAEKINFNKIVKEANPFAAFVASKNFMTPLLAMLFAVCALHSLASTGFDQSFNYYIRDQFQFSSAYNGILKAAMGLITLVANSTLCVYLIKKTDVRKSVCVALGVCATTMLWIININQITMFLAVNVLFFAFTSICLPLLQSVVADNAHGEQSNLVMGFYNSVKGLGGIFGAVASGALYVYNPKFPFVCSMLALVLATVFAGLFYVGSIKKEKPVL